MIDNTNIFLFTSVPTDRIPTFGYPVIDFVAETSREEDEKPQLNENERHCSYQGYIHPNWGNTPNIFKIYFTIQSDVDEKRSPTQTYMFTNIITIPIWK